MAADTGASGTAKAKNLEQTPTYRVAFVVFVFVAVSIVFEKALHHLAMGMKKRSKKGLYKAIETVKDELMLLGFISLLLTIFQDNVKKWCVTIPTSYSFYPCSKEDIKKMTKYGMDVPTVSTGRHLLAAPSGDMCPSGQEAFMSSDAMHYIHYFIFILAVVMVVFSSLIFVLSFLRIRMWKNREEYAQGYVKDLEPMTREERMRWAGLREHHSVLYAVDDQSLCPTLRFWIASFFMLFFRSVNRENYQTLRMHFISTHNLSLRFNFHDYLIRCMEDDFANVVGISIFLWSILIAMLLINVAGSELYLWTQMVGVFALLIVGTKLLAILRTLTRDSASGTGHFITTVPRPMDELFWFSKPLLIRDMLHFILFLNSVDISSLIFFWWKFGLQSCLLDKGSVIAIRLGLAFLILYLSAFVILPIYALVSQMGTTFRGSLFSQNVEKAVNVWAKGHAHRKRGVELSSGAARSDADEALGDDSPPSPRSPNRGKLEKSELLPFDRPRSFRSDV